MYLVKKIFGDPRNFGGSDPTNELEVSSCFKIKSGITFASSATIPSVTITFFGSSALPWGLWVFNICRLFHHISIVSLTRFDLPNLIRHQISNYVSKRFFKKFRDYSRIRIIRYVNDLSLQSTKTQQNRGCFLSCCSMALNTEFI